MTGRGRRPAGGGRVAGRPAPATRLARLLLPAAAVLAPLALPQSPAAGASPVTAAAERDRERPQEAAPLRGRVVLGPDSLPVRGVTVALHRIAGESGGVVDRDTTDARGRFRLAGPSPSDSAELYLAATRYEGALYFGPPYRGGQSAPSPYAIQVFESAPLASPGELPVSTRHLILRPDSAGGWGVTDLIEVRNESDRTYVAPEGRVAVWSAELPDRASGPSVSEAGVAPGEVTVEGGRLRVASSVSPGAQRVAVRYTVPEGQTVTLPLRRPVRRLEVLVRGEERRLRADGLAEQGPVRFRGEIYRRYSAADLEPGARVSFAVGGGGGRGMLPWLFLAAGAALLAAAAWLWTRQGGDGPTAEAAAPSAGLVLLAGAALAAAAPPAAAAPAGVAPAPDTVRIPDDRGDTLTLAGPADRVVSLIPAATEILFALGAGDRVAGRTRYGTHPPEAREVPSVGQGVRPSAEAVLARRPDAVVVYSGQTNRGSIRRFEELGIPVLALEHNTVPQLMTNIGRLGLLTGRRGAADSLRGAVRRELERVAALTAGAPRRRVYYDVWSDPPRTIGAGSYLDSLISVAGGRNVFGDLEPPSPQVSLEAVAERRPEVILFPRGEDGDRPAPTERPAWRRIPAVREGAVRVVDGELLHRLGPRLGDAAAHLAAVLHPSLSDSLRSPARATTWGAPSSGPGPGWRTIRTGQR